MAYYQEELDEYLNNNYHNLGNDLYYCDHDELIFSVDEENADFDPYDRCFKNYQNFLEDPCELNKVILKLSEKIKTIEKENKSGNLRTDIEIVKVNEENHDCVIKALKGDKIELYNRTLLNYETWELEDFKQCVKFV